ncbi:hypothetical protein Taro_026697 [Colocasia esculenta]|uniref:Uncharacterized protein n=1 Tax=Colocasia esculenta TaxID=4460 RepID=A0A843VHW9_COLES|nr:hypothetical protein [Colocasia esculenta]
MGCVDTLSQTATKDFWEGSLVSTLLDPVSTLLDHVSTLHNVSTPWALSGPGEERPNVLINRGSMDFWCLA